MEETDNEFVARSYQVDLYEKAVTGNTIVYLPTGSGKTFIAAMLLKKMSADIQKLYSEGGKRTIFAVNTVALVTQQTGYLARHTSFSCKGYTGDMNVDSWSKEYWLIEFEQNQVLVMTSQIFLQLICHGIMPLNRVNLIVFDECHRAVSDHPMRQIMQLFEKYPKSEHPRILALSATLLNSNVKLERVQQTIQQLEITFHAKVATVESASIVKGYSTNPIEKIVKFDFPISLPIVEVLEKLLISIECILNLVSLPNFHDNNLSSEVFKPKSKNSKLISIIQDIRSHVTQLGLFGGDKAILLHMIQLEYLKKYNDDQQTVYVLEYCITQLMKIRKLIANEMKNLSECEQILTYSSDQVLKLFLILQNFNTNKTSEQKFCCIIFVKRRFTAKVLYHILKDLHRLDKQYEFLLPEFIVGFSNDPYKNAREILCISKWNREVLLRFKSGRANCVVATDVVDEGLDIPSCTLVVRFDEPQDFRSYIQSKGRARSQTSEYILLISENADKFLSKYHNFKKIEEYLQQLLVGRTNLRAEPTHEQIEKDLYDTIIEPYSVTDSTGVTSMITAQSAISLVNQYCSSLYKSKFICLSPTWTLHKNNNPPSFMVTLAMPPISNLKEIVEGDWMPSVILAKRSAALKCCVALHRIGELSDCLIPNDIETVLSNADYLFPHWEDESKEDKIIPGTNTMKRQHKLVYADALYSAYPIEHKTLYLHVIDAKPTYPVPQDNRRFVLYNLLSDSAGFAILSTKPMPQIPSFPIFMNVGELSVDIKVNHKTMELTADDIRYLDAFHAMIFSQVIPIIKAFMVFDKDNLDNSFLVVPIDAEWNINWDVVKNKSSIVLIPPKEPFHVSSRAYELALVTPNYRGSLSVYVVTQVCEDLTADSSFPTEDYYSYVHYFSDRHALQIKDPKQPMLEVKSISTKINCIRPRGASAGLSKRKRADIQEDLEEHLVPELCDRIDFPALYWLKITTLPSILHRITQFLVADELRNLIAAEAKLGLSMLPPGEKWEPLMINNKEGEDQIEMSLDTTMDDVIPESSLPQPELSGPEIDVLGIDSKLYSWTKDEEPSDMNRNIDKLLLIDIEYYYHFMNMSCASDKDALQEKNKVPGYMSKPDIAIPSLKSLKYEDLRGPSPVDIAQALTRKQVQDVFDLERLETLGDSFLKYAVSVFLYESFPNHDEGHLTAVKGKIIGNRNLYYCGKNKKIPGRMKVDDFVPLSNFIAPSYTVERRLQKVLIEAEVSPNILYELTIPPSERISGFVSKETMLVIQNKLLDWDETKTQSGMEHFLGIQTIPDKVVSDSVEALIGVYLQKMGLKSAAKLLIWFGILPESLNIYQILFQQLQNPVIGSGNIDNHIPWAGVMERKIGYQFTNRAFLLQAFTHPSYTSNSITACYQRLEFLGDAVLDFLITVYIFEYCGNLDPGALTDLRSALVNNITFASLAVRYGLHTALLSYAPKLSDIIDRFVKFQEERNHVIDDELLWVLLEEDECNMAEYVDVPKILGDIFESLIGAIYLDSGKNLLKVWEIVYALMHKEIEAFSKNVPKQPVRVIHETQGAQPRFMEASMITGTTTVMVPLEVVISGKRKLFHGFGANKKQAKCAAAKQALKYLRCKK
ncbi:endoribonuclease Dicer isoform X2 [Cephus cinctus]|nr:endoribonuclease Dicer isoform X2 [Cephus cinctus]